MRSLFVSLAAAVASTGALAADLPTHKAPPAPPPVVAPAFTWTGFYVGVNGGYAFGSTGNNPLAVPPVGINPNFASPNGGLVGGTVGYNYQLGQVVFGAEADYDAAFTRKGSTFANGVTTNQMNWIATDRLRLGYASDRALFYITGGFAAVSERWTLNNSFGYSVDQTRWRKGGAIGGGIEYALLNNVTVKAEYLWLPMADRTILSATPYAEVNKLNVSLARAGLNFKF